MAAIVNSADKLLQAAQVRIVPVDLPSNVRVSSAQVDGLPALMNASKVVYLRADSQVFQIPKTGAVTPATVVLNGFSRNLVNPVVYTVVSGTATLTDGTGVNAGRKLLNYTDMTSDSVTVKAAVTENGFEYPDYVTIIKVREGSDTINALLSNESHTLAADSNGNVLTYSGAGTILSIFNGSVATTGNWAFTKLDSAGITSTISANSVSITAVTSGTDAGYVDITAKRAGFADIVKRFTITKSKAGAQGTKGDPGVGSPGPRGNVDIPVVTNGSAWSDAEANAGLMNSGFGAPRIYDSVTLYRLDNTFMMTRFWDGDSWEPAAAIINGNLLAKGTITAPAFAAGSVTATSLAIGNQDNVLPDSNMKDSVFWNRPEYQFLSYPDTFWKSTRVISIGIESFKDTFTPFFPLERGGTYLFEFQVFISADFQGSCSVLAHLPAQAWFDMGAPWLPNPWPAEKGGVQRHFDSTVQKGGRAFSSIATVNPNDYAGKCQIRILSEVTAGYIQIGGIRITRVMDSVLIKDGAVTASKITVDRLSAISALIGNLQLGAGGSLRQGQWDYDQGNGLYLGSDANNNPRFSMRAANGGYVRMDPANGVMQMKGDIYGSTITGSVLSIESARMLTAYSTLAPFTIYDTGMQFSGSIQNASVTLSDFKGPGYGAVNQYDAKRFARLSCDVFLKAVVNGDTGTETLYLEVQYDGGGWTTIATPSANCNYFGSFTVVVRYTTLDSWWTTIAFRARTVQGHTFSMCFEVQSSNFNLTGNAPGSNSGISSGASSGVGAQPPRENWCVDYETTVLPNGNYVRDLQVGDLVLVWNDDAENAGFEYAPVQAIGFGEEQSYRISTESGVDIIQSKSTPMSLRDGRVATTDAMLGEDVLVNRAGALAWERVVGLSLVGNKKVVKVNLGDRMYFAGTKASATIATHNMQYKP